MVNVPRVAVPSNRQSLRSSWGLISVACSRAGAGEAGAVTETEVGGEVGGVGGTYEKISAPAAPLVRSRRVVSPPSRTLTVTDREPKWTGLNFTVGHVGYFKWRETQVPQSQLPSSATRDLNQPDKMIWSIDGQIH